MALLADNVCALKTFPVIEVFGPTIQGEGAEAGRPCYFVRFGGCDYRCSWCDTMYAVEPEEVRRNAQELATEEIAERVGDLGGGAEWVVLSGGNPALHELGPLVEALHERGLLVAVETQGSIWREWLGSVDRLTVSPKPPSSNMASASHRQGLGRFMAEALKHGDRYLVLKIVCFEEADLRWAREIAATWATPDLHLSAGTPVPSPADLRGALGDRYRWLCERVAADAELGRARVLPQLHVIAWGDERGV